MNIVFVILATISIGAFILARYLEAKQWNKGYCPCGGKWENFDMDSQGGRGYKCDKCDNHMWISYKVDKEEM